MLKYSIIILIKGGICMIITKEILNQKVPKDMMPTRLTISDLKSAYVKYE